MRRHSTQIGADEHLQARWLVIANQPDDREAISAAVLHRPPRAFRLIASAVLLFRLADNLQLSFAVGRSIYCRSEKKMAYTNVGLTFAR